MTPARPHASSPAGDGTPRRRVPSLLVVLLAFLAGSVPFSQVASRLLRGIDLRSVGGGTVSGTNLFEVAGFGPLAAAGVLEVAKGAVGPALAGRDRPTAAAVAAGASVCGHNWSPWLAGAGGRGLSPAMGAMLVRNWPGTALLGAGLGLGRLARATAPACLVAYLVLVPTLRATRGSDGTKIGAAIVAPLLVKRVAGNRRPPRWTPQLVWARLVHDRDPGDAR